MVFMGFLAALCGMMGVHTRSLVSGYGGDKTVLDSTPLNAPGFTTPRTHRRSAIRTMAPVFVGQIIIDKEYHVYIATSTSIGGYFLVD